MIIKYTSDNNNCSTSLLHHKKICFITPDYDKLLFFQIQLNQNDHLHGR